jgi:hypothetical protein
MDGSVTTKTRLSPTTRRLIRSYGLLVLIAIAFLLLAMFVHERPKTVPAQSMRSAVAETSFTRI